jgi:Leucine-rich repeat (LRR) protein
MNVGNISNVSDTDWVNKIFQWADENNIEDYRWNEPYRGRQGYWSGIPRDRNKLLNLTRLYIKSYEHEQITIPSEIGNLLNLNELDIFCNGCTDIPSSIGNLCNLTHLSLNCVRLKRLPQEISLLNKLEYLLVWADIKELPKDVGNLSNLRVLRLEQSLNLKKWPRSIVKLKALTEFHGASSGNTILPFYQASWIKQLMKSGFYVEDGQLLIKRSRLRPLVWIFYILISPILLLDVVLGNHKK